MKVLRKMGVLLSIICGLDTELSANHDDIAKQTQLPWDGLGLSINRLVTDRIICSQERYVVKASF